MPLSLTINKETPHDNLHPLHPKHARVHRRAADDRGGAVSGAKTELRELVKRAVHNVPTHYANWHVEARAALSKPEMDGDAECDRLAAENARLREALEAIRDISTGKNWASDEGKIALDALSELAP